MDGVEAGFISNGSKTVIDDLTPGNHEIILTITQKGLLSSRESIISRSTAVIYSKETSVIEISNSFFGWSVESKQFETSQDRSPNRSDEESKNRQVIIRKWIFIVAFLVVVIGGIWFYVDYNSPVRSAERRIKELERMQEIVEDALDSFD